MSILISAHAHSLRIFLTQNKTNRNIKICDSGTDGRILSRINLTGKEDRPFTREEIMNVLYDYRYFKDYFTKMNLWPDYI